MSVSPKAFYGALSGVSLVPTAFFQNPNIVGVGFVIGGAALGTYAAIAYDEERRPRGRMFSLASATVIIASALTGVLPHLTGWHWINGLVGGGAAALCALIVYFGLPELIPTMRRIIRGFKLSDLPFFRKSDPIPATPPPPPTDGAPDK